MARLIKGFRQLSVLSEIQNNTSNRVKSHRDRVNITSLTMLIINPPKYADIPCRMLALHTNLVDPASSHMLVSKIKPCKCKYKFLYNETAKSSLKQL